MASTDSSPSDEFHQLSYQRHADHWQMVMADESWRRITDSWFDQSTADYWQHQRLYEAADYLADWRGDHWLTIGDGRFGLDSARLRRRGIRSALPTDIGDASLKEGKARGIIDDYRVENAEQLSFDDLSFDFVFCKEAFHHLPRPYLALYEMLRVATSGVVLVEPQDQDRSPLKRAIFILKKLTAGHRHFDETRYEDSGNYIYSLAARDLERVCLGINLPCIMFKGITSIYEEGIEFEPAKLSSMKFLKIRAGILLNGILTRIGLSKHNILMSCIFKIDPPPEVRQRFARNGWQIVDLPRNPYADGIDTPRPPA